MVVANHDFFSQVIKGVVDDAVRRERAEAARKSSNRHIWVAEEGNLSIDSAQKIKDAYAFYVPFFRVMESGGGPGRGGKTGEQGTGIGSAKGSSLEIRDPLVAMQELAGSMIRRARQNEVMGALYKFAAQYEAGGLATIVPKKSVPTDHPVMEIIRAVEKGVELPGDKQHEFESILSALKDIGELNEHTISLFAQKTITAGEKNVIAYTPRMTVEEINRIAQDTGHRQKLIEQQGKTQWLEVPTEVYDALMGVNKPPSLPGILQNPLVTALVTKPAQLTRFFATAIQPAFSVANIVRDIMSQPMFSPSGKVRPLGGLFRWIRGAALYLDRGGEIRKMYDEAGVAMSNFHGESVQRKIAGQHRSMVGKVRDVISAYERFLATPENFLRIAEMKEVYERGIAEGKPERQAQLEATEAAREITVNFARAGTVARIINQAVPYFNASIQGQRKLIRQLAMGGDAKGDVAKAKAQRAAMLNGIVNITVPSMILVAMFKDEEWYQDLPTWRKIHYWNFKIGDQVISWPKPYEAGVLFGSIPEMLVDSNPVGLKEAMKAAVFNYMDGPAALIPSLLRPSVEHVANFDFFRGRPITPDYLRKSRSPKDQSTFYTTESAKWLSEAFGGIVSPIEIEHWFAGHTAGESTRWLRAMDDVTGAKEAMGMWEIQNPVSRFIKQDAHGQSRAVDDLYTLSEELDQERGSDTISPERLRLRTQVERAKRQISDIRKSYRSGRITKDQANRRSFELARPLVSKEE